MTAPLLDLGFDGFVCSAGGYVGCGDQILVDLPLPAQQVQGLCEVLEKNGVECTLEARDDTFGGQRMLRRFETLLNKPGRRLNSEAERWRTAMKQGMTLRPLSDYQGQPSIRWFILHRTRHPWRKPAASMSTSSFSVRAAWS